MADQWYYTVDGQRKGPVAAEQLRLLASSGQVGQMSQIWKLGMATWEPASALPEHLGSCAKIEPQPTSVEAIAAPSPPSSTLESASVPAKVTCPHSHVQPTGGVAGQITPSSLSKTFKDAFRVVTNKLERVTLISITLPIRYWTLGKHIASTGTFRSDFGEVHETIDGFTRQLEGLKRNDSPPPPGIWACFRKSPADGLAALRQRAKALSITVKNTAYLLLTKLKMARAFRNLGKIAFEKHLENSGPAELVQPILRARARLEELDTDIHQQ